ncbi:hypothetical protein F511_40684 [Dorcoceras hygrometricum]|uniref:Uncharacterized protein n=1 Tax=Dorcoceras hygrometricum TaxID=472368 RepID=A0A2Z7B122_9LAMI|nr:hypothetical protein F511_40684 [Dorcoceras hygrometricum]
MYFQQIVQQLFAQLLVFFVSLISCWFFFVYLISCFAVHCSNSLFASVDQHLICQQPHNNIWKVPLEEFDPQTQSPSLAPGELLDSTQPSDVSLVLRLCEKGLQTQSLTSSCLDGI